MVARESKTGSQKSKVATPEAKTAKVEVKAKAKAGNTTAAVVILDSDEEAAQEEERQELEVVRRKHARKRMRVASESARQLAEKELQQTRADSATGEHLNARACSSYVRVSFRCPLKEGENLPSNGELTTAFADFGAQVLSLSSDTAVLAVTSEENALGCALAFHGWPKKVHGEAQRRVLQRIRIVTAPVTASGRAIAGPRATVAATHSRVAACDRTGPKFV